jgi:hypothetical protein
MDACKAILDERVDVPVGHGEDASAPASVAPVGAAARHVFLAPEADRAIAAFPGVDLDVGFVDEFHLGNKKALSRRIGLFMEKVFS